MTPAFPSTFFAFCLSLSCIAHHTSGLLHANILNDTLIFTVFYCKLQLAILMMARYIPPHLHSSTKVINLEMPLSPSSPSSSSSSSWNCSFLFLLCLFSFSSMVQAHFHKYCFQAKPFHFQIVFTSYFKTDCLATSLS